MGALYVLLGCWKPEDHPRPVCGSFPASESLLKAVKSASRPDVFVSWGISWAPCCVISKRARRLCECPFARVCVSLHACRDLDWGSVVKEAQTIVAALISITKCTSKTAFRRVPPRGNVPNGLSANIPSVGSQCICILLMERQILTETRKHYFPWKGVFHVDFTSHNLSSSLLCSLSGFYAAAHSPTHSPTASSLLAICSNIKSLFLFLIITGGNHQIHMQVKICAQLSGLHFRWI